MRINSPVTSNEDFPTLPNNTKPADGQLHSPMAEKDESESICIRSNRKKRILKKPESLLGRLKLEFPLSVSNVHIVFNVIALNQSALRNSDCQESFFKTMFYMRSVQKVELRKHALILQLRNTEKSLQPIEYLISRFKSFGDTKFLHLANLLERTATKLIPQQKQSFTQQLMRSFDGEPLSRFIDSMAGQIYMCKVAPNRLIISRPLLELLGEDPQTYAIELTKHRMPIREIISAEKYWEIMNKWIQSMGLVSDFVNGRISHDRLHSQTSLNFKDYIYDRNQKRIYCEFVLFMPTPQISCIQMRQILTQTQPQGVIKRRKQLLEEHCQQRRFNEAEVLKNIIKLPQGFLKQNAPRVAGYTEIPQKTI